MSKSKVATLVIGALILGLALGSVGIAAAAPEDVEESEVGPLYGACLQMGRSIADAGGRMIDIVADLTGLDPAEIHDERVEGKSLGDIAEENGVAVDDVVGEALDRRAALLQERVEDGTITEEQAAEALESMQSLRERMTDRIESGETGPFGRRGGAGGADVGPHGGGFGGPGAGRGGCGGYAPQDAPAAGQGI